MDNSREGVIMKRRGAIRERSRVSAGRVVAPVSLSRLYDQSLRAREPRFRASANSAASNAGMSMLACAAPQAEPPVLTVLMGRRVVNAQD